MRLHNFRIVNVHLFISDIPWFEKIFRTVIVYIFLLVAFRLVGKRQVGQLTSFDLVFLLIISNVVQNAIIGPDNSLIGGLIGATALFALNYVFILITFRSKKLDQYLEPQPTVLVHNGKILQQNMLKERITHEELMASLRRHGLSDPHHVRLAILEEDGAISVVANPS